MSISSINNSVYSSYLTDLLTTDNSSETSEVASSILAKKTSGSSSSGLAAYGSSMYSGVGQSAMQRAIEELKAQNGGRITFAMIKDYRQELEEEFELMIQVGLGMMGFEDTEDFQIRANANGEIEILCNDPELKKAVDQLFEENPELEEQFLYIQALGNIERGKETMTSRLEMQHTMASLQADAMDLLLNGADYLNRIGSMGIGYSSLLANFDQNSVQYMLGANYTV